MERKLLEQSFIGSLLRFPKLMVDTFGEVSPAHIMDTSIAYAYDAMCQLFADDKEITIVTVVTTAGMTKANPAYLSKCQDIGTKSGFKTIVDSLLNESRKDRLHEEIQRINHICETDCPDKALAAATELIAKETKIDKKDPAISKAINRFCDIQNANRKKGTMGISTGIDFFENLYIKYVPGHVWVQGGYTSVGKTAQMVQQFVMKHDCRSMIISTEMTEEQMIARILANKTAINSNKILEGRLNESEDEHIANALKWLNGQNFRLYDDIYNIDHIEAAIMKAHLQGGLDVVWIDYVQNIQHNETNEYQGLNRVAKRIQVLAKKARCCIHLMSQVSNAHAQEGGVMKFKGAGELAAVADVGIEYKSNKDEKTRILQNVGKHRHGKRGQQVWEFVNNYTSLEEIQHKDNE